MIHSRSQHRLQIGDAHLHPEVVDGELRSLGAVDIGGTPVRNSATRFMPYLDTYEGEVFRTFHFHGIERQGETTFLTTRAISDPDALWRERRDSSGDPCFRNVNWDAPPREAAFVIGLRPAAATLDGREFTGFTYWFEYTALDLPIHRLVDRQTWEVGGNLDDVTICLRNWLTPPRMRIARETTYSTVGLDEWAGLLPGNLWGRWSLLPAFDFQYGKAGVLVAWFDRMSCIRTVIESNAGEDCLRCLDLHLFEQSGTVLTNPKTILWCPDVLDDVDALNLWTRVQDQESAKARQQLGMPEEAPPAICLHKTCWWGFRYEDSYHDVLDLAEEFHADYIYVDPPWEHLEAYRDTLAQWIPAAEQQGTVLEKFAHQNMCGTLDFQVASLYGGEAALTAFCDRARARGVGVLTWIASHYSPHTNLQHGRRADLGHGKGGIFAAKESGTHPDTGYSGGCWPMNLNAPIYDYWKDQLLGVCERTGLAGFLWDSFCNLGWWHLDYSDGTMRPQYDKQAQAYAEMVKAGLYVEPEALVTFSNHSCVGLHGGNVYQGDQLGFSYNSAIALLHELPDGGHGYADHRILRGEDPIDYLFRCYAHKRAPLMELHQLPREECDTASVAAVQALFCAYKAVRQLMVTRTVLKGDRGVLWENETPDRVFFSFQAQACPCPGQYAEVGTGQVVTDGQVPAWQVYRIMP